MIAKMAGAKPKVAIIGAGPGGIAMGIQLAQGGYDFTIFDRGEGFGGTWRNNTYPGAACDVPSHFYSYSYALNPRWSKTFANQPEILAYLEKVAADNQLGDHLVARSRVTTLRWSDTERRWTLETVDGARHQFDAVVTAVGMLDVPNIPDIAGAARFSGRSSTLRSGITRNRLRASVLRPSGRAPAPSNTCPRSPGRRASDGVSTDADLGEPTV